MRTSIAVPQFEVVAAYGTKTAMLDSALGIYLSAWFIVTFVRRLGQKRFWKF